MEVEQRIIIKFLWHKGAERSEIHQDLIREYGDNAYSLSTVNTWIRELIRGREDLTNQPAPGRPLNVNLAASIAAERESDPHLSARKIAKKLEVAPSTVCRYLKNVLQLKCRHMRWIPHRLSEPQKAKRAELAVPMLRALAQHDDPSFSALFTGDESWMFYDYHPRTMWVASWEEPDEFERTTHHQKKTMITIFFNVNGQYVLDILPKGAKMNSEYFAEHVIANLGWACRADDALQGQLITVHFDNAPIHNTKRVADELEAWGMERLEHPPYSPDLAPCDFFLFGYLKELLADKHFSTEEELTNAIGEAMEEIPKRVFRDAFIGWQNRLQTCCDAGGMYIE
jgi:histone-lysine N-methyltransferase SETMAR